jgi:hypothetical protein
MGTSAAARRVVTYHTLVTLLVVGLLPPASVTPLYAEPAATQPVNSFGPVCAAASVPRAGFLLPTLAVPATGARPRLVVSEHTVKGTVPLRLSRTDGQSQTPPKQKRSWFARNWWWVIPAGVVVAGVIVVNVKCADPSMCD